jgi:hypothetical protein
VKLPGAGMQNKGSPGIIGGDKPELPGGEKPSLGKMENPIDGKLNTDINAKLDVPDLKEKLKVDELTEVQQKVDQNVGDVSNKISGYGDDAKNLSTGNVDEVKTLKEDAMKKAGMDEELGVLKQGDAAIAEQKAALEEQKAMAEKLKNKEAYKQYLMQRSTQLVTKAMTQHDAAITKAVEKVNKFHKRSGTVFQHTKDLPKQRDPLRKLKFYEKFVPGVTMQLYKSNAWLADVNPSLRYRLTIYWSIGSGYSQRFQIGGDNGTTLAQTKVYGVRSFTEVIIFKGIAMRFEGENMNALISPYGQPKNEGERQWVWNYFAGLKKEFSFVHRVVGNVQFMYNVYDGKHYGIYPGRLNVRFGFEYPLQKRKHKKKK